MASVSTKPPNGIQRRTHESWCVGDEKIIEETRHGRFNVCHPCYLNMDALRRLHAVLGTVLADLDADPFAAHNSVTVEPEF